MPKVKNPPGPFRLEANVNRFSSLYLLLHWLEFAASADFDFNSSSHQPNCSDEELDEAISNFENMLNAIQYMIEHIGILLSIPETHKQAHQYLIGVSYAINFFGSLSMDLQEVLQAMYDAKIARVAGKYVYQPDEGGDHE